MYIDDGNIPINNNPAENAVRPFVIGCNNWLFSGSRRGAHASVYSGGNSQGKSTRTIGVPELPVREISCGQIGVRAAGAHVVKFKTDNLNR